MRALSECQIFFLIGAQAPAVINRTPEFWFQGTKYQWLKERRRGRRAAPARAFRPASSPLRRPGAGGGARTGPVSFALRQDQAEVAAGCAVALYG